MPASEQQRKNTISEYFKRADIFGHSIMMNFDNKYPVHHTFVGAIFSIVFYVAIFTMIGFKIQRVVSKGNPDLNSVTELSPDGLKINYNFSDMNVLNFYGLKKQRSGSQLWLDMEDLDTYLRIYFIEETADYSNIGKGDVWTNKIHPAVQCTQDHFGFSDVDKEQFKPWKGYSVACLDKKAWPTLQLQGNSATNDIKNLIFLVDRCQNWTRTAS
jgi:hypothetical protein